MNGNPTLLFSVLLSLLFPSVVWGARAPSSTEKLERIATHIVLGEVRAVYSYKERDGMPLLSGYEYERKVAEVKIEKVEKGKIAESLVYVRYWSRAWKGIGLPPPGGQSYDPQPKKGQFCRFYLAKNAYDGWSKSSKDGGYNVVYLNGVQPLER